MTSPETLPDDIAALQTALTAERAARQQAEARASGAEAMVAYLKLLIAKMKRERFGQSAERGRKLLDQLELQLEELEASATEDAVAAGSAEPDPSVGARLRPQEAGAGAVAGSPAARARGRAGAAFLPVLRRQAGQTRRGRHRDPGGRAAPVEGDPDRAREVHLPGLREDHPAAGAVPRHRRGPGPGASLLAMILYAKFGKHQPLNRQSESYAREGIELDVSTLADWVGACTASLAPLH